MESNDVVRAWRFSWETGVRTIESSRNLSKSKSGLEAALEVLKGTRRHAKGWGSLGFPYYWVLDWAVF